MKEEEIKLITNKEILLTLSATIITIANVPFKSYIILDIAKTFHVPFVSDLTFSSVIGITMITFFFKIKRTKDTKLSASKILQKSVMYSFIYLFTWLAALLINWVLF